MLAYKDDLGIDKETVDQLRKAAAPLLVGVMSFEKTRNLQEILGQKIFELLGVVRIYTKEPGSEPAKVPVVAREGVTVGNLAKMIHNDFFNRFKYARIWGPSAKFDKEKVGLDRELKDGTVIQIYV